MCLFEGMCFHEPHLSMWHPKRYVAWEKTWHRIFGIPLLLCLGFHCASDCTSLVGASCLMHLCHSARQHVTLRWRLKLLSRLFRWCLYLLERTTSSSAVASKKNVSDGCGLNLGCIFSGQQEDFFFQGLMEINLWLPSGSGKSIISGLLQKETIRNIVKGWCWDLYSCLIEICWRFMLSYLLVWP